MIAYRRLYFESHAIAASEMKSRLERSSLDAPRQMPMAERMLRLKRQQTALTGVIFDATTEPSHSLVDKILSMVEDGIVSYLPPQKCPSREHEVAKDKLDNAISFSADGNLKITKKAADLNCDVQGEVRIRSALTRRSLAFDQVGLAGFVVQEKWHAKLFNTMQKEPPMGHKYVTLQQALAADRQLWTLVAQETRNSLQIVSGNDPPLDAAITKFADDPQVMACLMPLPSGSSSSSAPKQPVQRTPET